MDDTTNKTEVLDGHLKAAHTRLERELVRILAGQDGNVVRLHIDGTMAYPSGGETRIVNYFDLVSYCEGLKLAGMATYGRTPTQSAEVTLTEKGLETFKATDFYRLMRARDDVSRPKLASSAVPTDHTFMSAITALLFSEKQCRRGIMVDRVGNALGVPLSDALAGKSVPNVRQLRKAFDRSMKALERSALIEKKGSQYKPTQIAWKLRANKTLKMPPAVEEPKARSRASSGAIPSGTRPNPALVSKSTADLVAIWKNAMTILGNPIRRPQHEAAAKVVAQVTLEWERRLDEMNAGRFPWPSTVARGGNGRLSFDAVQAEGMLAFMEYHVGRAQGEPEGVRRAILGRVFEGTLPPAFPKAYMEEWGGNGSVERLQKMAFTIAAFVRNVKRRKSGDFSDAIKDWEDDLEWLRKTFYVNRFRFALGWPETAI